MEKTIHPLSFIPASVLLLTTFIPTVCASIDLNHDITFSTNSVGNIITVIDERHLFLAAGSLRIPLDQLYIEPETIVVWDTTRTKFYFDYNIMQADHLTEVQVIPGGDIFDDGDQILSFDYDYQEVPEPATVSLLALGGLLLRKRK